MLSVGTIRFEDRFHASKKGGIGGGGRVSAQGAIHMTAALAGCRKDVMVKMDTPKLFPPGTNFQ